MPTISIVSVKKLLLSGFEETIAGMIRVFTLILVFFAAAISIAVLYNISRISFSERSWELASLRIIGFDSKFVFNFLFLELGLQVIMACLPGLLLGYFLSFLSTNWIHSESMEFPLIIEQKTYAFSLFIVIAIYFSSAIFLARRVKQLSLTDALKARE